MATANILWSLLFGSIGIGYFIYGKRQAHTVARYTGIALMIYPYFIGDTMILAAVGVGLLLVPRFWKL